MFFWHQSIIGIDTIDVFFYNWCPPMQFFMHMYWKQSWNDSFHQCIFMKIFGLLKKHGRNAEIFYIFCCFATFFQGKIWKRQFKKIFCLWLDFSGLVPAKPLIQYLNAFQIGLRIWGNICNFNWLSTSFIAESRFCFIRRLTTPHIFYS